MLQRQFRKHLPVFERTADSERLVEKTVRTSDDDLTETTVRAAVNDPMETLEASVDENSAATAEKVSEDLTASFGRMSGKFRIDNRKSAYQR